MGTKTIKSTSDSNAGIVVSENAVRANGSKDNSITIDDKGITLNGPMSIPGGSSQIRFSALWTMNTELMLSLPSTLATPMPVMTINPPVKQIASLVKDATVMIGLMTALGGIGG